jgi:hypothetical protein
MIFEPFPQAGYLDQFAHALIGSLITIFFMSFGIIWYKAIGLTMLIAFVREMIQHPFRIPAGSRTDLLFWLVGCGVGVVLFNWLVG